jgi:hypothetical protein
VLLIVIERIFTITAGIAMPSFSEEVREPGDKNGEKL